MAKAAFAQGDRVAWDHAEATKHAAGSILRGTVLPDAERGTVEAVANEEGTYFRVKLDSGDTVTLTNEELVRVEEEEQEVEE